MNALLCATQAHALSGSTHTGNAAPLAHLRLIHARHLCSLTPQHTRPIIRYLKKLL